MNLRPSTALAAALIASAVAPGAASADTLLVSDPSASNITVYGSTAAWSRKADDGTYRLVVRNNGQVADAPVPASSQPYDPDLGPTSGNGRAIVYARGGDLYRFDVGTAAEQKITALSTKATERAPSFYKDAISFARTDGSRPGWYLARPGRALERLTKDAPVETDLAATRVAARFGTAARSFLRQSNYNGDDVRTIARAKAGEKVSNRTLTRFNVYWYRPRADARVARRVCRRERAPRPDAARRRPAVRFRDLARDDEHPGALHSAQGVMTVEPKLRFR